MRLDFGRPVGESHPPFIIASMDCQEIGSLEHALLAIDVAAKSNVDAIKLAHMPFAWCAALIERAEMRNLTLFTPALDETEVSRLDWLGASGFYLFFNWSDLDLVARAAATGKPIVLQVGTATEAALAEVVATAQAHGDGGIALVQSVIDLDLEGLDALHGHGAVIGIVDHSPCSKIPMAAIHRGASIVEKQFSLKPGATQLCPVEVSAVVRDCEQAWLSLGDDRAWTVN